MALDCLMKIQHWYQKREETHKRNYVVNQSCQFIILCFICMYAFTHLSTNLFHFDKFPDFEETYHILMFSVFVTDFIMDEFEKVLTDILHEKMNNAVLFVCKCCVSERHGLIVKN